MAQPLATMLTITTYGTWLRGDCRGWVDQGIVHPPDPVLEEEDRRRLRYEPWFFPKEVRQRVGKAMGESYLVRVRGVIHAMTVCSWHAHVVVGPSPVSVALQVKCLKDAARWALRAGRPIWGSGYDKRHCLDAAAVLARVEYVRGHNLQEGLLVDPWDFVVPFDSWG